MVIYPAIDLIGGKCVRLTQGKYDDVTVYDDNPLNMAKSFQSQGAAYIHMVDLDGARSGISVNSEVIKEVAEKTNLIVQTGGGIRSLDKINEYLEKGIGRVILGTSAVNQPELVKRAVETHGEKIVIGIDAKDGKVAVSGWETESEFNAVEFAKKMQSFGVKNIIYTDISRDGMLTGPNLKAMEEMASALKISVIASGGVSCLQDVIDLKSTGVSGVIIGKAIYAGRINLEEALNVN